MSGQNFPSKYVAEKEKVFTFYFSVIFEQYSNLNVRGSKRFFYYFLQWVDRTILWGQGAVLLRLLIVQKLRTVNVYTRFRQYKTFFYCNFIHIQLSTNLYTVLYLDPGPRAILKPNYGPLQTFIEQYLAS